MCSLVSFRAGDEETLALEFLKLDYRHYPEFAVASLEDPAVLENLVADNVWVVHFADGGAQGEGGAVKILYGSQAGIQILYGNYIYGNLDLNVLLEKLPILRCLDNRDQMTLPYPFGGRLSIPRDWGYMYLGALNHLLFPKVIQDKLDAFIKAYLQNGGRKWKVFAAVAWFCGKQTVCQSAV